MLSISVVALTWLVGQRTFSAALDPALEGAWRDWKTIHAREYHEGEEDFRRGIWEETLRMVEQHNYEASLGKHNYELGMNQFSDLTDEEFDQLNGYLPDLDEQDNNNVTIFQGSTTLKTPLEVDWRARGYVTPVKNQDGCGSCWAFSATGALEGLHFNKTGHLVSLSEQNLVDCSWKQGNNGCKGGRVFKAFQYVMDNKGINSENTYPYKAKDRSCHFKKKKVAARCTSYKKIEKGDLRALEQAVATVGPISVSLDAHSKKFKSYKKGVFSLKGCGEKLNHAVTVVGYGTSEEGLDYWILKNNWGKKWGENGYMRLAKGDENHCGIATRPTFPIL